MAVLFTRRGAPSLGKLAGDYEVGSGVFIPINGVNTEFLVVHQGNPATSIYSSTFNNGTILLMKDCYSSPSQKWNNIGRNDYENSTIHTYLNNEFFSLINIKTQNIIKQVKIPYRKGYGTSTTVSSGENGLSTKIFLLSLSETYGNISYEPVEGIKFDYFISNQRIAYKDNVTVPWWLRTPGHSDIGIVYYIQENGSPTTTPCTLEYYYGSKPPYIRPAMVIPNDTLFDKNNIIT